MSAGARSTARYPLIVNHFVPRLCASVPTDRPRVWQGALVSIFYRDRTRVEFLAPLRAPPNGAARTSGARNASPVGSDSRVIVRESNGTRGTPQTLPTWFIDRPKDGH